MLLREWFAWYRAMPAIEAQEQESFVQAAMLADSGWQYEHRQEDLQNLHQRALGDPAGRPDVPSSSSSSNSASSSDASPESLRQNVRRVFAWLRQGMGGSVNYG